jgi:hypothetical protein
MQERGELLAPEDSLDISRKVKEVYCYTCSDIVKVLPFYYPLVFNSSQLGKLFNGK